MIALVDVHISHGGQPSHASQSPRSQIPSSNLSMRWMSAMLPHRVFARNLVALPTNPCFKCPQNHKTTTTIYLIKKNQAAISFFFETDK
jgi:hypothetical protein